MIVYYETIYLRSSHLPPQSKAISEEVRAVHLGTESAPILVKQDANTSDSMPVLDEQDADTGGDAPLAVLEPCPGEPSRRQQETG